MEEISGTVSYCCNKKNVTGDIAIGGIVGNNRGQILYVYNIAEQIKSLSGENGNVGGIAANQNTNNSSSIQYAYNTSKISGYSYVGGIVAYMPAGTVDHTYHIGVLEATQTKYKGNIAGYTYSTSAITNSPQTTKSEMEDWSQATININLPNFWKKTNGLPILNITVRNVTF